MICLKHNATAKRPHCDHKIDREIAKVSERFYWSRYNVATTSPTGHEILNVFWAYTKDWPRYLATQRFYLSPRSLKVVLFSSQIRPCGDQCRQEKGGDVLHPTDDLFTTDQCWGDDWSALHRRLVAFRLQSGFQACADHSPLDVQKSPICRVFTEFTSRIFYFLIIINLARWGFRAQASDHI